MQQKLINRKSVEAWIRLIKLARAGKDWEASDTIRDYLRENNITVSYKQNGEIIWEVNEIPVVEPLKCSTVVSNNEEASSLLNLVEGFAKSLSDAYSIKREDRQISFWIATPNMNVEDKLRKREEIRTELSRLCPDLKGC